MEKQVVLGGIIPGKRYRVSCEVECDSERDLLSDDDDLIISTITPPCKFNFLLKSRKLLKEKPCAPFKVSYSSRQPHIAKHRILIIVNRHCFLYFQAFRRPSIPLGSFFPAVLHFSYF